MVCINCAAEPCRRRTPPGRPHFAAPRARPGRKVHPAFSSAAAAARPTRLNRASPQFVVRFPPRLAVFGGPRRAASDLGRYADLERGPRVAVPSSLANVVRMNVAHNLLPDLGHRLRLVADHDRMSANAYTLRLLDRHLSPHAPASDLVSLVAAGSRIVFSGISVYEAGRELLRGRRLRRLDALADLIHHLPLTTAVLRQPAVSWADAPQRGQPPAHDRALDGDVIPAAHVATLDSAHGIVATTTVGHLSRHLQAALWRDTPQSGSSGRRGQ